MTPESFSRVMGALRMAGDLPGVPAADYAHAIAHLAPDHEVEAMAAKCRTCGAITRGTWQVAPGGRRLRTPSQHIAPPVSQICAGSFAAAELIPHPGKEPGQ